MKRNINVATGEVEAGKADCIMVSNGIGSCVVVTAFDLKKRIGAMAHIMLPGKAPLTETQKKTKYAVDAIDKMLQIMQQDCNNTSHLRVCLIGGGNVLQKKDDTICENNIQSVLTILKDHQIVVSAKSLGGFNRRAVRFDVENGEVYYTEGESKEMLLMSWEK